MSRVEPVCVICGEPMMPGEEMFRFHGYVSKCPKPPLANAPRLETELLAKLRAAASKPRFDNVSCSQCGEDFGPGDHGFSHCEHHRDLARRLDAPVASSGDGVMFSMSGRADYGDATTVGLIDELADLLKKAEEMDAVIFRRLRPEQHATYEALIPGGGDALGAHVQLRKYAHDWQDRLDAEIV